MKTGVLRVVGQKETVENAMVEMERALGEVHGMVGGWERVWGVRREGVRGVREVLGEAETARARLEYEVGVVEGRVRDLEDAVGAVEGGVRVVEGELGGLEGGGRGEWWGGWGF